MVNQIIMSEPTRSTPSDRSEGTLKAQYDSNAKLMKINIGLLVLGSRSIAEDCKFIARPHPRTHGQHNHLLLKLKEVKETFINAATNLLGYLLHFT
jgi:hypothetical protein